MSKSKVKPGSPSDQNKDKSLYVHQREKIDFDLKINLRYELTDNQNKFLDLIADSKTRIVIARGPAGTSKTYCAVLSALRAMQDKKVGEIYYIRQPVESSSFSLGALKGELSAKMQPYLQPLFDKISELTTVQAAKDLEKQERIKGLTIGHMRGLSINAAYVITDESQNFLKPDFLLMMTRMGKFSKLIILGDNRQSDLPISKQGDFDKLFSLFSDNESNQEGVYTFEFKREDIVREKFIGFILDKFESFPGK